MADGLIAERTLLGLFLERARRDSDREATRHLHHGTVVSTSWGGWERRSRTLATALIRMGTQPGDRVAILSGTRVEWAWLDMAIVMAGAISVPICAFYKLIWDIKQDWKLGVKDAPHWMLRKRSSSFIKPHVKRNSRSLICASSQFLLCFKTDVFRSSLIAQHSLAV